MISSTYEEKLCKLYVYYETYTYTLADSGFFLDCQYQGGVKPTVFGVFEDLKFKISEGYDQNWCFPDPAQLAVSAKLRQLIRQSQENINLGPTLHKF